MHANTRSNPRARLVAALAIAILGLCLIGPDLAMAHARLTSSNPAPGSALARMPATIEMDFSEAVDPGYSSASLLSGDGSAVATGPIGLAPGDDHRVIVPVPGADSVPGGIYTLVWRILSATDGHVTTGTVAFSVGSGAAPVSNTGGDASTQPPWWRVALRWGEIATLVSAAGGFFFLATAGAGIRAPVVKNALSLEAAGLLVFLGLGLHDQAILLANHGFFDPPPLAAYRHALFDNSGGRYLIARAALALVMLGLSRFVIDRPRARLVRVTGAGAGAIALAARSASGHAAGVNHAMLAIVDDWLHLVGVSVWFGGLVILVLSLRAEIEPRTAAKLLARFSKIALGAVLLLIATGTVSAAFHVAGARSLRHADYGLVLIAKHLLFVPAVIAAGVNLLIVVPRLKTTAEADRLRGLVVTARRLISMELAFAMLVLFAAAALTELAPANGPLAVDVASRIITIDQTARAGDLDVQLIGRLSGQPEDRFVISVAGVGGRIPADLQRLIVVSTDSSDAGIGDRFDAQPLPGSPGSYFFPAVRIGLATVWDLNLIVRRAGVDDVSASMSVDVRAAAVQPPRLEPDHWRWPRLTVMSYLLAPLALVLLIAGIIGVRRLPGLEPIAGGLVLTMTALVAAGFLVQAIRSTVPVTAGAQLANPAAGDPGALSDGSALYTTYCLACHGASGEGLSTGETGHSHGDSAGLLGAQVKNAKDGDLYWYISAGVAGTTMPAFDQALTDGQRWDLVQYLRQLQQNDGVPATPTVP